MLDRDGVQRHPSDVDETTGDVHKGSVKVAVGEHTWRLSPWSSVPPEPEQPPQPPQPPQPSPRFARRFSLDMASGGGGEAPVRSLDMDVSIDNLVQSHIASHEEESANLAEFLSKDARLGKYLDVLLRICGINKGRIEVRQALAKGR